MILSADKLKNNLDNDLNTLEKKDATKNYQSFHTNIIYNEFLWLIQILQH